MDALSQNYLDRAETWMIVTTLAYFLMNGAQIFETAVIVPKWTAEPPESFVLFKGKSGLDFKWFWIACHSLHEITFVLALVFCWKLAEIRNWLLLLFILHLAVRIWTLAYFAPKIIGFQNTGIVDNISNIAEKTAQWRNLNYFRVAFFLLISFGLLPICYRVISLKLAMARTFS